MSQETEIIGSASVLPFPERLQWKIPDFFTAAKMLEEYAGAIHSSAISSSGCDWVITLVTAKLAIQLTCDDERTGCQKKATCYVGSTRLDFNEELTSVIAPFPSMKYWAFGPVFHLDELKSSKAELVPSDTLTITIYLEDTDSDLHPRKEDTQRLMGLEDLSSSFEDLFFSKKKTDATLKVEDKEFAVHKLVLIARCPVLSAMFGCDTSEDQTGVVTVPDCDSDTFQDFLHHLYTGKFDRVTSSNVHHLFVTAVKCEMRLLRSFCVDHMKQNLTVENVLDVATLADRYEESELLSSAHDFFNQNLEKLIPILLKEDSEFANRLLLSKVEIVE